MLNYAQLSPDTPKLRCAIYTRKSCEEGLDQNFNSLDAQRLAAENYIASQHDNGWVLLPEHYDDGGCSGGNMERPALKRLLEDIKEKKVDCIVFYKFDRLSRSMVDFSNMLVFFDKYNVKFVSVTEAFDTTKSAGRFAFHSLLTVAQYERDIASERIRDKFAASKKKGYWMGGTIPMGYDVVERELIINKDEAETIRFMYQRYIETQSITLIARELHGQGIRMKTWVSKRGNRCGGYSFDKNNIRRILSNPLYTGKITHKGKIYTGKHNPIIDEETAQKVQALFAQKQRVHKVVDRLTSLPLLQGLVYCGECNARLSPTSTTKHAKKRYRYYICEHKNRGKQTQCPIGQLSADAIEPEVIAHVIELFKRPEIVTETINISQDKLTESAVITALQSADSVWDELFPLEQVRIINLLVKSVIVMKDKLTIHFCKAGIFQFIHELNQTEADNSLNIINRKDDSDVITLSVPIELKKRSNRVMIIPAEGAKTSKHFGEHCYDIKLINAFAKAFYWQTLIQTGKFNSLGEICKKEKLELTNAVRLYRLNFVAPKIVEAVLQGKQPRTLCLQDFVRHAIPVLWDEQLKQFGFEAAS